MDEPDSREPAFAIIQCWELVRVTHDGALIRLFLFHDRESAEAARRELISDLERTKKKCDT